MHKEEIENKLKVLREELEENQEEYREVTNGIEDLSWQLDNLENDQYRLEKKESELLKEIQELEKRLMDKEFGELDNALTGDKFRDAFIKCSWFCRKYEDTSDSLTYVKITGKRLMATDGYRGIVVECDNIPEELKNTFIKWNIRDNFKDNSEVKPMGTLSFMDYVIKKGRGDIKIGLNERMFKETFLNRTKAESDSTIEILNYCGVKVAFNKEYLDIALKVFKDMDIKVYWPKSNRSPMILESNNQNVILLPIFLSDYNY